jgi:hypothetical protein
MMRPSLPFLARPAAALVAVGVLACWSVPDADRRTITAWLTCIECTSGELDRVLARGSDMVPHLERAVEEGPTPRDDSLAARRATQAVQRIQRYRTGKGIRPGTLGSTDSARFVQGQHDAFTLSYRLRAAQALQRLDSAAASAAVSEYCRGKQPALDRRPEFRTSFGAIGPCR